MSNTIYIRSNLDLCYAIQNSGNSPDTVFKKISGHRNYAYYQSTVQGLEAEDRALFLLSGVLKIMSTLGLGLVFTEAISDLRQAFSGKVEIHEQTMGSIQPKTRTMSDFIINGVEVKSHSSSIYLFQGSLLSPAFRSNEAVCKAILVSNSYCFSEIDPSLQKNEDFAFYALSRGVSYFSLPSELRENGDFALRALQKNRNVSLSQMPSSLRDQASFIEKASDYRPGALQHASEDLKDNKTFILGLFQQNKENKYFSCLSDTLRDDLTIILAAMKGLNDQDIEKYILPHLGPVFQQNKEVHQRALQLMNKGVENDLQKAKELAKQQLDEEFEARSKIYWG